MVRLKPFRGTIRWKCRSNRDSTRFKSLGPALIRSIRRRSSRLMGGSWLPSRRTPAEAKLVFDWPAGERKDAELIVDGSSRTIADGSGSVPFALTLKPGRHVVHITRRGFEPFNQSVDLSARTNSAIKPIWTRETKIANAPTVVETPVQVETTAPRPAKKLPVPAAAEQEKIAKQLNELYKTSQPSPKDSATAHELYDVATKGGSSPAERYMLLMKGAEIAAAAGDLNLSLHGVDTLDADYDIDALEVKQQLLDKFIAAGKPDQVAVAIPTAEHLVEQAVAADRYDVAVMLATSASKAVAKSKIATHKEVEERLARRCRDIHLMEPIYAAATKARESLKTNSTDPEANLTVGRWLCFYKGDWTTGLPMLAKGSDEKLKSLAEQEIKTRGDADQQAQVADAWWDQSQDETEISRESLRLHAGTIYQSAMPNLRSALKKAAIEKRLTEIADRASQSPPTKKAAMHFSGTFRITSRQNNYYLAISQGGRNPGDPTIVWRDASGDEQLWTFVPARGGEFEIGNKRSGLFLAVRNASKEVGADIIQWSHNDGANQLWLPEPTNNGFVKIVNKKSGLCLGILVKNGQVVDQERYEGLVSQQWKLTPSAK